MRLTPSPSAARLEHVDALRGFALFLVLLINIRILSLFEFLDSDIRQILPAARWDQVIDQVLTFLFEQKAVTVFTLLFGISFALQYQRMAASAVRAATGREFVWFYVRRLLVLLAIGIIHSFFWFGDVLRWYAVMGLLLLPTIRVRSSIIIFLGIIFAVVPWTAFSSTSFASASPSTEEMLNSTFVAFSSSNFAEMLKANFAYDWWYRSVEWGYPLALFGRFLIGVAIGRSQFLITPGKFRTFWIRFAVVGLPTGMVLTTLYFFGEGTMPAALAKFVRSSAALVTALGYIAIFILAFNSQTFRRRLRPLAAVGRMTLTNYLLQTFVAIMIFYGIGFAVGPRFGLVGAMIFAFILFALQIMFSQWWLKRFEYGPVEWMWRCLTYGEVIPLRKI